jgi:magnesium-transporting ATPase (P-type)
MKNVFKITNKYLILLTPLILYSLFSSIYMTVSVISGKLPNILFALVVLLLMSGAFISGWLYMIKFALQNSYSEDINSLIKEFPIGVSEYFISSLGAIINTIIFSMVTFFITYKLGMHFIGDTGINLEAFANAMESTTTLKAFLASLSAEQLLKMGNWNILILSAITVACFLFILYFPAIFYKEKNPYKAILVFIKDLFSKKFFKTLGVYLLICVANFIISILSTIFAGNQLIHFFITLVNFYFVALATVGVFYYYQNNFVSLRLGQNVDIQV